MLTLSTATLETWISVDSGTRDCVEKLHGWVDIFLLSDPGAYTNGGHNETHLTTIHKGT